VWRPLSCGASSWVECTREKSWSSTKWICDKTVIRGETMRQKQTVSIAVKNSKKIYMPADPVCNWHKRQTENCKLSCYRTIIHQDTTLLLLLMLMGWDNVSEQGPPRAYCSSPTWHTCMDSDSGKILTEENQELKRKPCPSAILSTTNPTWTDPSANLGLHSERPTTNCLSHCYNVYTVTKNS
jgi:hypothetical protein